MVDRFRVGVISSVHGIHGECKVFPTTEDVQRFKKLKTVYVNDRELKLSSVKFFKNMAICKFEGIDTPEEMQKLRGMDIMVSRENAIPLNEGEHYIADLIGCRVISEDGTDVGECEDIIPTGANLVMQVHGDKDFMIPYIRDIFILDADPEKKEIRVHLIDGLTEI